jgi:hypothetical protein
MSPTVAQELLAGANAVRSSLFAAPRRDSDQGDIKVSRHGIEVVLEPVATETDPGVEVKRMNEYRDEVAKADSAHVVAPLDQTLHLVEVNKFLQSHLEIPGSEMADLSHVPKETLLAGGPRPG